MWVVIKDKIIPLSANRCRDYHTGEFQNHHRQKLMMKTNHLTKYRGLTRFLRGWHYSQNEQEMTSFHLEIWQTQTSNVEKSNKCTSDWKLQPMEIQRHWFRLCKVLVLKWFNINIKFHAAIKDRLQLYADTKKANTDNCLFWDIRKPSSPKSYQPVSQVSLTDSSATTDNIHQHLAFAW